MDQFFNKPQYNSNMDEPRSIILTISDNPATESYPASEHGGPSIGQGSVFSPLAPPFQSRINKNFGSMVAPPEPQVGDTAPDFDLMNLSINDAESIFESRSEQSAPNYFMGSKTESAACSGGWADKSTNKTADNFRAFDFMIRTLSAAHSYVSILTKDQIAVLQSIRPKVLFDLLQDVVKYHQDNRRTQRTLSRECAFCKNNGEPEDKYSAHALKDCRGRVLCPVLRAFCCPRCGATGDRAHTIKYCPTNIDKGMDRGASMRQRASFSSLFMYNDVMPRSSFGAPSNPPQSPSSSFNESFFSSN
ncbi:uncharacterized protein LOC123873130 isoform X2 [Maniola jurtina]|uniref:uncharacterized protein LOC123873130 isoform X2 n=1 Tax=Maniola jurtina TaxID=191418 RepID=UPI001E68A32E|nr:uncharacterized protein LOC123873130 isoform X2 [Maniola jurtina]